ncbi:MAG: DUF4153 domain-containing protein [Aquabacterium sp.]
MVMTKGSDSLGESAEFHATRALQQGEMTGRLVVALIQAVVIYWLSKASDWPFSWPATDNALLSPIWLIGLITPLIFQLGWRQIDLPKLVGWCLLASVAIFVTAHHDAQRSHYAWPSGHSVWWPSAQLVFALATGLFVAHVLIINALEKGDKGSAYARHFDLAWRIAVQISLTAVFVGLMWGILILGGQLFMLVKIKFLSEMIKERWFAIPVTTLTIATAIHLTDLKPGWIRAVRGLILGLYSALLPLLAVITLVFLARLPFVSLDTLWKTHFAGELTLGTAFWLVVLINSLFQDGNVLASKKLVMRMAALLACLELIPLALLSAQALRMRVEQHGWTVDRVFVAAAIAWSCCYALGYAVAVIKDRVELVGIKRTNVLAAYLFLTEALVLFSGILDPAKVMVANQLSRLESGQISPEKFDYFALKDKGAQWGTEALRRLAQTGGELRNERVMRLAKIAQDTQLRYEWDQIIKANMTPTDLSRMVTLLPADRQWPKSFYNDIFTARSTGGFGSALDCPVDAKSKCVARYITIPGLQAEVLIIVDNSADAFVFQEDASGHWSRTAWLEGDKSCGRLLKALEAGDIHAVPPPWPDFSIAGQTYSVHPLQSAEKRFDKCGSVPASR